MKHDTYLRAQRTYDSMCPDEDDNWRECVECRRIVNMDAQELDSNGRDICDECLVASQDALADDGWRE